MLTSRSLAVLATLVVAAAVPSPARAQSTGAPPAGQAPPPATAGPVPTSPSSPAALSPVNDLIAKAKDAIDNLQFDEALTAGREALQQRRLRVGQTVLIQQVLAAAFFPDPADAPNRQQTDSASHYLRLSLRLQPDAQIPEDLRWRGLDSLFVEVKKATFAAVARPQEDYALTGFDGRAFIDVITTRPASFRLVSVNVRTNAVVTQDSVLSATRARLALRAHDGARPLFQSGDYQLRIEVEDVPSGERQVLVYDATAVGTPPVLERAPEFDSAKIKPERTKRRLAQGISTGLIFGAFTVALSQFARAENPIRSGVAKDGRAMGLGVLVALGGIAGGVLDKGLPLPANVEENRVLRAQHAQAVTVAQDQNRRKAAEYKVQLHLSLESR
jgi:hypothetical protein